jgi:c-di-GMP-binding flagellar brake protein YcgR
MDHPVYSLSISKLFEIQRREVFRVTIKNDVIKASFDLSNGKSFTVTEISEKGFALAIPLEEALTLHQGSEYRGNLVVQPHAAIDLSVKIVRIMETNGEMKAGCEIVSGTQAIHQKVASLVTECHRILFAKMT